MALVNLIMCVLCFLNGAHLCPSTFVPEYSGPTYCGRYEMIKKLCTVLSVMYADLKTRLFDDWKTFFNFSKHFIFIHKNVSSSDVWSVSKKLTLRSLHTYLALCIKMIFFFSSGAETAWKQSWWLFWIQNRQSSSTRLSLTVQPTMARYWPTLSTRATVSSSTLLECLALSVHWGWILLDCP